MKKQTKQNQEVLKDQEEREQEAPIHEADRRGAEPARLKRAPSDVSVVLRARARGRPPRLGPSVMCLQAARADREAQLLAFRSLVNRPGEKHVI